MTLFSFRIAPTACNSGEYSNAKATSCTICPAGYSCPTKSDPPIACASGEYSSKGQITCDVCPSGSKCTATGGITTCPPGMLFHTSWRLQYVIFIFAKQAVERSGLVVENLTRDRRAAGSSLTDVTALCP